MSDHDPQYDASRVMFNGAAIGLVTSLVNGMEDRLRAEIHATEQRLSLELKTINGDVDGLELWRADVERARQRREGQWSVVSNSVAFLERHGKVILAAAVVAAPILAALLGVRIVIGS